MSKVMHFLLVFDHDKRALIDTIVFDDGDDVALAAYAEYEERYQDTPRVEVVLIGSDSLDTVRMTHANYFAGADTSVSRHLSLA